MVNLEVKFQFKISKKDVRDIIKKLRIPEKDVFRLVKKIVKFCGTIIVYSICH